MQNTTQQQGEHKNILTAFAALFSSRAQRQSERALFIETYPFPGSVRDKLKELHPERSHVDITLVMRGLRDWFQVCLVARGRFVSMPSRIIDDAWHAFILDTRAYEEFCDRAFGRFLHHTPAEGSTEIWQMQPGLLRAWKHAAELDHQDPERVDKLPLLFGIDAQLAVPKGLFYALDWHKQLRQAHQRKHNGHSGLCGSCGGGISGGSSGSSGASCGSSCGSGCGGGCGGS